MKPENQRALDDFLSRADEISEDILEDTREMLGSMPFIFPVLKERPEYFALSGLADEMVCRPPHIPAKTAELIAIAAAAGAGAESCLRVHIRAAMKEGANRDEIYDTILIASLIGKTRVLAPALREFRSAFPDATGSSRKT
ncbi:carboxymuconolactone decarboxylase family protein [Methanoregula formicica]|uniref:Alkylhydroperoxidase AhpD family core domain protein n=1 Tax=Methanoregula formicica (strain DSM 22288 / NBRC 105244 / SMSP) TaxID=593750 RepID=L0HDR4_METFS|nr:carboxymuconolactone decarboxylase family protein [Methanoregula formicica]AGB01468.1 alkylhydroperoxidase AhpD family core domain protein [Methanoregula formicica SMSP]